MNDIEVIALAHNINDDPVASHSFFGTDDVIRSMQMCEGYDVGMVTVTPNQFMRGVDGRVCGIMRSNGDISGGVIGCIISTDD